MISGRPAALGPTIDVPGYRAIPGELRPHDAHGPVGGTAIVDLSRMSGTGRKRHCPAAEPPPDDAVPPP